MSFVVRRVHAKCPAFNLQRKLLPIFIKPPKGFGDGSEARLFLDIKENNFFFFYRLRFSTVLSKKKKIHLYFRLSVIPWNEPSSTESLERSWRGIFRSSNPSEGTVQPQVPPKAATTPHLTKAAPWAPLFPAGIIYPHLSLQTSYGIKK